MNLRDKKADQESENSAEIYESSDSGGVRYVKDGETFAVDSEEISDENSQDGRAIEELSEDDLENEIEAAKAAAERTESDAMMVQNAKMRGGGQLESVKDMKELMKMLSTQDVKIVSKGQVYTI